MDEQQIFDDPLFVYRGKYDRNEHDPEKKGMRDWYSAYVFAPNMARASAKLEAWGKMGHLTIMSVEIVEQASAVK